MRMFVVVALRFNHRERYRLRLLAAANAKLWLELMRLSRRPIALIVPINSFDAVQGHPERLWPDDAAYLAKAIWLQMMVPLTAVETVELQGYFRVADGYYAADHTFLWGCKIG